jgi:hypothetical protein
MIDDPNKTDLLMAMLKESLPVQAIITEARDHVDRTYAGTSP